MKQHLLTFSLLSCLPFAACMADDVSVRTDTLRTGDSLIVITTACAPVCSSVVQVFNAKGEFIGRIEPPYHRATFPEAYIEDNKLRWRDNTAAILDEDEKR